MTVWHLLWVLWRYAVRGRGRERVYIVTEDLPDPVQTELDALDLAIVQMYAPRLRQGRFVVVIARPDPTDDE